MPLTLRDRAQSLEPGKLIELFIAAIPNGPTQYFHKYTERTATGILVFHGLSFIPWPIMADGWEYSTDGALPRPHLSVGDLDGLITALMLEHDDLIGTVVSRIRTFEDFLDGKPSAGSVPDEYPRDIYVVDSVQTGIAGESYEFELVSPIDNENIALPNRQIKSNACDWIYRGPDCFSGNTKFFTDVGLRRFDEMAGKGCQVLTANGFETATIKEFGIRETVDITFRPSRLLPNGGIRAGRSNYRRTITATPSHHWLLLNGETRDLKVGDVVLSNALFIEKDSSDYSRGYVDGLIFGDGTTRKFVKSKGEFYHEIPLYGRAGHHTGYFENLTWHPSSAAKGIDYAGTATIFAKRNLKKELPSLISENPEYLAGFLTGWIAADGQQGEGYKSARLDSQNREALDWAEEIAPLAGFIATGKGFNPELETNFGKRSRHLHWLRLAERTEALWTVESITPNISQPVYCAVVKGARAFTLEGGIYTHNCTFVGVPVMDKDGTNFGFVFTDGVMNSTTTLISAGANFVAGDVGKTIAGNGIPPSTIISARVSATQVTLSHATAITGSNILFYIYRFTNRGAYNPATTYALNDYVNTVGGPGINIMWVSKANANTAPLTDSTKWKMDTCPKRLRDCASHFGKNNVLPFGAFPGSSRVARG